MTKGLWFKLTFETAKPDSATPRFIHYLAVLTVCAAVPLLFLGAEVTTKRVGMVDTVGLREPWHLLTILDRAFVEIGLFIEHSHRLVGFIVGVCVIGLTITLWVRERRGWVRVLGVAALLGICLQGALGIYRVNLNALMGPELALIHGCFAQLVFAALVALALCTSRSWVDSSERLPAHGTSLATRRWTVLTAMLIYLQIVLGAVVRHTSSPLAQRGHLVTAFAVVAAVVWLLKLGFEEPAQNAPLIRSALLLSALVALQVMLGVEAWMLKFSAGTALADLRPIGAREEVVRTAHFLVGSAVFATAVVVSLEAYRQAAWASGFSFDCVRRVEGAV